MYSLIRVSQNDRGQRELEKVRPWCGQPSDRGRLKNRTEQSDLLVAEHVVAKLRCPQELTARSSHIVCCGFIVCWTPNQIRLSPRVFPTLYNEPGVVPPQILPPSQWEDPGPHGSLGPNE